MEKYGFVYIWRDRKYKRYYIGSHWGREDDGYICSSTWMRNSYNRRPLDFRRKILNRIYTNRIDLFFEEEKWLALIPEEELGTHYYNLHKTVHHWTMYPDLVKTIGEKISIANKGRFLGENNPFYNKQHSEETKKKISISRKGKCAGEDHHFYGKTLSEEHKQILYNANKGSKHSEEHKRKIAEANKNKTISEEHKEILRKKHTGKILSDETKKKISEANKGNPSPNKGKAPSEETRKKMREAKLGKKNLNYPKNRNKAIKINTLKQIIR